MYTVWFSKWEQGSGYSYTTEFDLIDKLCTAEEYLYYMDEDEKNNLGEGKIFITESYDEEQIVLSTAYTV